ncbi:amino acid deaminase/aldolase [Paenibacillus sp. GCM10027627]|uniref:amino acid deaminase/aldolase n=1 Tax=unclassified Paenibacillus TaxID=185978 RepID=UPI00362BB5DD
MRRTYDEYKRLFAGIPMPFAFLDLDMLDQNAVDMAAVAGGKRIRIATKSIRSVEVLRRLLTVSPVYKGLMCFTAEEADFLAAQGFDDLLLGYPQGQPAAVGRLLERVAEGQTITFMVDSLEQAERLANMGREKGTVVPICLDLDLSVSYPGLRFGVWRSPLSSWLNLKPVAEGIAGNKWLRLDGLMGYEAQVAGVADRVPGQGLRSGFIRLLKKRAVQESARRRREAVQGLREMGVELRFVNAGGTGSLDSSSKEPWVTEVTAGSGLALFDHYSSFRYQPAAGFAVEVVRQPRADIVTCLGGGYSASGSAGSDRLPTPYLPEGLSLFPLEGAGEVQTPLRCKDDVKLVQGDPVFFRHAKAGELCERFPILYTVSQGSMTGTYFTYRGMGECFL